MQESIVLKHANTYQLLLTVTAISTHSIMYKSVLRVFSHVDKYAWDKDLHHCSNTWSTCLLWCEHLVNSQDSYFSLKRRYGRFQDLRGVHGLQMLPKSVASPYGVWSEAATTQLQFPLEQAALEKVLHYVESHRIEDLSQDELRWALSVRPPTSPPFPLLPRHAIRQHKIVSLIQMLGHDGYPYMDLIHACQVEWWVAIGRALFCRISMLTTVWTTFFATQEDEPKRV